MKISNQRFTVRLFGDFIGLPGTPWTVAWTKTQLFRIQQHELCKHCDRWRFLGSSSKDSSLSAVTVRNLYISNPSKEISSSNSSTSDDGSIQFHHGLWCSSVVMFLSLKEWRDSNPLSDLEKLQGCVESIWWMCELLSAFKRCPWIQKNPYLVS